MLALAFHAGAANLAIPARQVIEVLPRVPLRETSLAPAAVVGLLPYRGTLTPVVDLCLLVAGRNASARLGTRIIVVKIGDGPAARMVGLLAEDVSELLELGATTPGLNLPDQPWLGEHIRDQPGLPQLVEPGELLPEALRALFCQEAPA